ncbi:MAG: DUF4382 domain-containing protein [Bacteroidota bacterium]|nr:DUF4382 domain-containing protein [Bacteroidota bacterium]
MKTKIFLFTLTVFVSLVSVQCSKDEGTQNPNNGQLSVKITDAPSDDANIQATFVTIADVKVDGQSMKGFQKQTVRISDLQSGKTQVLFSGDVQANTYSNISLVMDYEKDASGNAPGCYVLDKANAKHNLNASSSTTGEIKLDKSFLVTASGSSNLIIDFDLRKSIVYNANSTESQKYKFVTEAELKSSLRVESQEKCGDIKGKASNYSSNSDLIVYAYHKGQYNASTETQGQGSSSVTFAKAVTSSKVNTDGTYQLSFLNEGDYEIHVASYSKDAASGKLTFNGMANANSMISGLLMNSISVSANANIELNFNISILP